MGSEKLVFDPFISRTDIRLTTLYSVQSSSPQPSPTLLELTDLLRFGRLAEHYRSGAAQLPQPIYTGEIAGELSFIRWTGEISSAKLWLFTDPAAGLVMGLTVNVKCSLKNTILLLEDLYYADFQIDQIKFIDALNQNSSIPLNSATLGPERHQLIFAAAENHEDRASPDMIQRLIYRADLPARENTSCITYPGEINRRPTTLGALGPYVSVLIGQQDYLENSCLISAIQLLGAHANLREISEQTYQLMRHHRHTAEHHETNPRLLLQDSATNLAQLELDLSYRVESSASIAPIVPALRVTAYHEALYSAMGLPGKLATTENMLKRLRNAIDANTSAAESQERRVDDYRRLRATVAISFVTTAVGAIGLIFAFFGANSTEVDENRSMFDVYYWPIYGTIMTIFGAAAALFLLVGRRHHPLE